MYYIVRFGQCPNVYILLSRAVVDGMHWEWHTDGAHARVENKGFRQPGSHATTLNRRARSMLHILSATITGLLIVVLLFQWSLECIDRNPNIEEDRYRVPIRRAVFGTTYCLANVFDLDLTATSGAQVRTQCAVEQLLQHLKADSRERCIISPFAEFIADESI